MNWNTDAAKHKYANKSFYITCPDNDKYYRVVFIRYNPFSNALVPHLANPVMGVPPDGMDALPPSAYSRLFRVNIDPEPCMNAYY